MRTTSLSRAAAVLVLAVLAGVGPARAHSDTSPVDSARGSGMIVADALRPANIGSSVSFTAREIENGATGTVEFASAGPLDPGAHWTGEVSCLAVDNKLAVIGGAVQRPEGDPSGQRFALLIRNTIDMDYGEDPVFLRFGAEVSGNCTETDFVGFPVAVASVSGRVHDGDVRELIES